MVLLLPFVSILLGYLMARFFAKNESGLAYLLSFSGAFLLSVTLFEMLPEAFDSSSRNTGILIMSGILLQIILDFFSKGAEHGHVHLPKNAQHFPWLLFISLSIHAFIEGFPVTSNHDILLGVIIHKIPIAIILTLYFKKSDVSTLTTVTFLLLFAIMTPLGSLMAEYGLFLKKYLSSINAVAIGVFLHVATTILFESSKDHKFNFTKLLTILLGVIIAYFI
jgi:zinc transporter ZupT